MATIADYIVMSDAEVTIVPNPRTGSAGEHRFTVTLPNAIDLTSSKQRAVLMFKGRTQNGTINAEIDVNARRVRNLPQFQSPVAQTVHEVVSLTDLRPGASNDFLFRVVSAQPNAEFYVSDIVLWFQREGFGPN